MTRTTVAAATATMTVWALCAGALVVAQSGKTYKGRLSPVPMTTAQASTIAGLGSVQAVASGNKVTITGTFDGLKSPATIAQIHRAPRGIRGPVVADLKVTNGASGTSGVINSTLEFTPPQLADLEKGWLYVQLHSEKAPEGNLWGWLLLQEKK